MNFYQRIKFLFASKESQARIVTSFHNLGRPVMTPANYEAFSNNGYRKNVVVFTAISKITTACSGINWVLYKKKSGRRANWTEMENHPLLDLLDKPNPLQSRSQFIESVVGFKKIAGNSYIEINAPTPGKPPLELWPVRPDKMRVVPGASGYPLQYCFDFNGMKRFWDVDQVTLQSDILHQKTFNPLNDWYGMSPLEAAMLSVDQYNQSQRWNLSLLQKSAMPSGILQMKVTDANPRGELNDTQYAKLKSQWDETYGGSYNAGRPAIMEGGLEWKQVSLSPKDMDFINAKTTSATDIALAYGVPPEIIGMGTKTFANYKEARLAFYEETILPEMDSQRDEFNKGVTVRYGDEYYLDYDKDAIDALVEKRESKYTSLGAANFLNENEKRVAAGYDEVEGFDIFIINGVPYSKEEFATWNEDNEDDNSDSDDSDDDTDTEGDTRDDGSAEDTEESEDEETEDEKQNKKEIEFKAINLLNDNEKRKSWIVQNKLRAKLQRSMQRDVSKDFQQLSKELQKTAKSLDGYDERVVEFALVKEASEWSAELKKTLEDHTRKTLNAFGKPVLRQGKSLIEGSIETKAKADDRFDFYVEEFIKQRTGDNILTITNTTTKKIKRVVSEWVAETVRSGDTLQDLSKFLQLEFEGLSKTNAMRIARTEVALASNNGALEAVKALEVPEMHKEWVSANDDRVRDDASKADHRSVNADNGEIPLDEEFQVNPDILMKGPGDPSAPAEQVINCRCVLVFKNKGGQR